MEPLPTRLRLDVSSTAGAVTIASFTANSGYYFASGII